MGFVGTRLPSRLQVTEASFPRMLSLGGSLNQDGTGYPCSKMSVYYLVQNAFICGISINNSQRKNLCPVSHSVNIQKVMDPHFHFWHRLEVNLRTPS